MLSTLITSVLGGFLVFASLPTTTTYQLNSYGFGSGGTANSSTGNYSLEGISGEISGNPGTTTTYTLNPGFVQTQQANVPQVALSNPASYYDKLKFVIDQQNNPSDALYALQIKAGDATCNFGTGTINYIKSDLTVGASLTLADYQTYLTWGGATGNNIIGLAPGTTYCVRVKATQGKFTESAYGPSSSAVATSAQQISFCIYTSGSCAGGGASEAFAGLVAGSVSNSPSNIGVDFATNADSGGSVYIYSLNGGLKSNSSSFTITSATVDLSLVGTTLGYGALVASSSSVSAVSPYNGAGNNVGILSTSVNTILNSNTPVVGGTAAVQLQAKASNTTPAATDYADTVTIIAAARF
jgi:hypothetical protein